MPNRIKQVELNVNGRMIGDSKRIRKLFNCHMFLIIVAGYLTVSR